MSQADPSIAMADADPEVDRPGQRVDESTPTPRTGPVVLVRETRNPRERRRAPRALRRWPVEIKDSMGRLWRGTSLNVSPTGMRVSLDRRMTPGRLLFVSFDPGDSIGPFWSRVSVVYEVFESREYGISFLDLPRQNVDRLAKLVTP